MIEDCVEVTHRGSELILLLRMYHDDLEVGRNGTIEEGVVNTV